MANFPVHYYFTGLIALTYVVVTDLKHGSQKEISLNNQKDVVLRMPIYYLFLGLIFIGLAGYIVTLLLSDSNAQKGELWLELLIFNICVVLILFILGIYYLMLYVNHKVSINEKHLVITNWRGTKTKLSRSEIRSFRDALGIRKFRLITSDKSFKVHQYLVGLATIKNWMNRNADDT